MLDILPVEKVLEILEYLPVQTLHSLLLVSRDWEIFIQENETSIYRKAALLHGFLPSSDFTSVSDLGSIFPARTLAGVHDWKGFCRRRRLIDRSWCGNGPSLINKFTATGGTVHRIKIDESAGYIITTSKRGGLYVTDLLQNELLWSLPEASHPLLLNSWDA
jgi:F-box-like